MNSFMQKLLTSALATVLVMSTLITPAFADVTVPGSDSSDGGSATVPSAGSSDGGTSAATVPGSGNANGASTNVPGSDSSNGASSNASVPTGDASNGGSSTATTPSSESSNGGASSATVPASGTTNGGSIGSTVPASGSTNGDSSGAVTPVAGTTNGGSGAGGGLTFIPEAPVRSSGGGGGGGNGPVSSTNFSAATNATSTNSIRPCAPFLTVYFSPLISNTAADILKLQTFLKDTAKFNVIPTGIYDVQTINAVAAFQTRYASEVLSPWGVSRPSGNVFISTRKKINSMVCANAPIVFTASELATMEARKAQLIAGTSASTTANTPPAVAIENTATNSTSTPTPTNPDIDTNEPIFGTNSTSNNTASVFNAVSNSVGNFFSKIYHFFVR